MANDWRAGGWAQGKDGADTPSRIILETGPVVGFNCASGTREGAVGRPGRRGSGTSTPGEMRHAFLRGPRRRRVGCLPVPGECRSSDKPDVPEGGRERVARA